MITGTAVILSFPVLYVAESNGYLLVECFLWVVDVFGSVKQCSKIL